jgi:hypothetical protein
VIWILVGLNTLYVFANVLFMRLDRRSNLGNVEKAMLRDVKEDYAALGQDPLDVVQPAEAFLPKSTIKPWQTHLYIFLSVLVLVITWISFGIVMGYKHV